MELRANPDKRLYIQVGGRTYARYAITTHFVSIGESYVDLVRQYISPIYREGDILSCSEKIIALCQERVVYKTDMKLTFLAKFLSRFAMRSDAGIGVDSPWKMQFAIDHCGALKVLWAAVCSAVGKLFGKHGIFYSIVGQEVTGLDGFYDHEFAEYGNYGIRIPEHSDQVCDEIYDATGVVTMIVDANDITRELLGKASCLDRSEEELMALIADNPAGQGVECTPLVLIRDMTSQLSKED